MLWNSPQLPAHNTSNKITGYNNGILSAFKNLDCTCAFARSQTARSCFGVPLFRPCNSFINFAYGAHFSNYLTNTGSIDHKLLRGPYAWHFHPLAMYWLHFVWVRHWFHQGNLRPQRLTDGIGDTRNTRGCIGERTARFECGSSTGNIFYVI